MTTVATSSPRRRRSRPATCRPATAPTPAPTQPVFMAPTPLFHVTACNCLLHPARSSAARSCSRTSGTPGRALELIERERVTNFSGVPTMSRELLLHPDWATRDTSSLRGMGGGGAPLQPDLVDKIDKALEQGAPSTGYGLTETHGIVTANSASFYLAKPASCGPVVPTLDAKLVDEDGDDLPPGARRRRRAVRPRLGRDQGLPQPARGDRRRDPRRLVQHRRHRPHRRGRLRVHRRPRQGHGAARRRERVLLARSRRRSTHHDDVAEAAVFGVPDERLGEDGRRGDRAAPRRRRSTRTSCSAFLAERIAKHKIPAKVWFATSRCRATPTASSSSASSSDELTKS